MRVAVPVLRVVLAALVATAMAEDWSTSEDVSDIFDMAHLDDLERQLLARMTKLHGEHPASPQFRFDTIRLPNGLRRAFGKRQGQSAKHLGTLTFAVRWRDDDKARHAR